MEPVALGPSGVLGGPGGARSPGSPPIFGISGKNLVMNERFTARLGRDQNSFGSVSAMIYTVLP